MKNDLRGIFKNNIFVKPLYKKRIKSNKIKPDMFITVDTDFNLDGNEFCVKRKVTRIDNHVYNLENNKQDKVFLPGACDNIHKGNLIDSFCPRKGIITHHDRIKCTQKMLHRVANRITGNDIATKEIKVDGQDQARDKSVIVQTVPNYWLRLYPAPKLSEESVCSMFFRCILCQLGLSVVLVLWTIVWVFVIHSFEGPNEIKASLDFAKEQNQLVIDLATELRQITPLSPRWKNAIEKRIEDERQLTIIAITRGARVHPGQFWDLSGTFLFTVYVMTALGFGAPMPQTVWGRTSALSHALFAVPTHIYLMVNASTCIVLHVEELSNQWRNRFYDKQILSFGPATRSRHGKEIPNCTESSKSSREKPYKRRLVKCIMASLRVLGACRCVPLAAVVYYVSGAVIFGVLRDGEPLDVVMFPLEFTSSGGLEQVKGHVRILYGLYLEGAMILLACALATLRQHSDVAINSMSDNYRLFASNQ